MNIKSLVVLSALSLVCALALAAGYRSATLFDYRRGATEFVGFRTNFGGTISAQTDGVLLTNTYYIQPKLISGTPLGMSVGWSVGLGTNYVTVSGADSNAVNGNYDITDAAGVWTNGGDGGIYSSGAFFEITNGVGDVIYTNAGTDITGTWYVGDTSAETPPTNVAYSYHGYNSGVLFTLQKSYDGSNWVSYESTNLVTLAANAITNHTVSLADLGQFGYVRCSGIYNSNVTTISNLYMRLWWKE